MRQNSYTSIVRTALAGTQITKLLESHEAVVLERIAMGAGSTNWYCCRSAVQLVALEELLSPGSAVSFYFDGRIRNALYTSAHKTTIESIITETGDVVIGQLNDDGLHIDVEFVDNAQQLAEVTKSFDAATRIFYGAFPGRDDDGIRAVTVILPDSDGIVRPHPH